VNFRKTKAGGLHDRDQSEQIKLSGGYDHNFVLDDNRGSLRIAASVRSLASGRPSTNWTTEPDIQFYSGTFLDDTFTDVTDGNTRSIRPSALRHSISTFAEPCRIPRAEAVARLGVC
jgi:galactose mutarotase-like enzyme